MPWRANSGCEDGVRFRVAGRASKRATDAVAANFPAVENSVNRVGPGSKSMDRWLRETGEFLAIFAPIVSKRRKAGL